VELFGVGPSGLGTLLNDVCSSTCKIVPAPGPADEIIITCVRWYLRFKLTYRDLAELARELGVSVAPSTILHWVIRYVPEFEKCWRRESFAYLQQIRPDLTLRTGGC
jgi:hypothetical protein